MNRIYTINYLILPKLEMDRSYMVSYIFCILSLQLFLLLLRKVTNYIFLIKIQILIKSPTIDDKNSKQFILL